MSWRICSGLLCVLALSACGGSSHSSTPAVTHSETQQASITVSTTSAQAPSGTVSIASSTTTSAATTSSTATTRRTTHTPVAPPPASGPREPATFTVAADGSLSPPTISVPAGYTVEVTFIDHASAQIHAIVHTPKPLEIVAPPGGNAYLLASHLPKGTYAIDINGKVRGSLVIGSAPGP